MNDDPLDDVLLPPMRESYVGLRDALRERTAGVVRRRRYRRRAIQVIAAAAAQGAIATAVVAWLIASGTLAWRERDVPAPREKLVVENRDMPLEVRPPRLENAAPLSAVALEWQAFDAAPEQQPALYFQAGQRYFDVHNDLESALRCYRQAFDSGSEELLTVSPTDNWLVMAIKIDCRKEN